MLDSCTVQHLLKIAFLQLFEQLTAAANMLTIDVNIWNRVLFANSLEIIVECLPILDLVEVDK